MKIVVDELPLEPKQCPLSKWHPYPPIFEETGYYECKCGEKCSLTRSSITECRIFVALTEQTERCAE